MSENVIERLEEASNDQQKSWIITAALLNTLPTALAEAAVAAAIPHWFDGSVLAALLQSEPAVADEQYRKLQTLSQRQSCSIN